MKANQRIQNYVNLRKLLAQNCFSEFLQRISEASNVETVYYSGIKFYKNGAGYHRAQIRMITGETYFIYSDAFDWRFVDTMPITWPKLRNYRQAQQQRFNETMKKSGLFK